MANIQKRGRSFEADIKADYLQTIQQAYLDFFRLQPDLPILILELEDADFQDTTEHYQTIKELISKPYPVGVHHLSLY
jgi:deoxyadenosine/deoxycytidine kinase